MRPDRRAVLGILPVLAAFLALAVLAWVFCPARPPVLSVAPNTRVAPGILYTNDHAYIDLNTADQALLTTLPGIGATLADRIQAYRARHGAFASVDELTRVSGIGAKKLRALRDRVKVASSP